MAYSLWMVEAIQQPLGAVLSLSYILTTGGMAHPFKASHALSFPMRTSHVNNSFHHPRFISAWCGSHAHGLDWTSPWLDTTERTGVRGKPISRHIVLWRPRYFLLVKTHYGFWTPAPTLARWTAGYGKGRLAHQPALRNMGDHCASIRGRARFRLST